MKHTALVLALAGLLMLAARAPAQTNVAPEHAFGWAENVGWLNLRGDVTNGVVVGDDYLSGYAWMENVGWLFLGDGSPGGGTQYTQAAGDTGVNNDGLGNLSGYAWGENIGWVNFDTTAAGGSQVYVDVAGAFSGDAWGENIGWISFGTRLNRAGRAWMLYE
jgi:hypothetical protein